MCWENAYWKMQKTTSKGGGEDGCAAILPYRMYFALSRVETKIMLQATMLAFVAQEQVHQCDCNQLCSKSFVQRRAIKFARPHLARGEWTLPAEISFAPVLKKCLVNTRPWFTVCRVAAQEVIVALRCLLRCSSPSHLRAVSVCTSSAYESNLMAVKFASFVTIIIHMIQLHSCACGFN